MEYSVQSLSHVQFFVTPRITACQASLSIINSQSLPKLMSIESVMSSNYLILCCPLLLSSIFLSIRDFQMIQFHIRWPVLPDVQIPEWEERRLPKQCNSQKGSLLLTRVRAPATSNAVVQGQRAPSLSCYPNL